MQNVRRCAPRTTCQKLWMLSYFNTAVCLQAAQLQQQVLALESQLASKDAELRELRELTQDMSQDMQAAKIIDLSKKVQRSVRMCKQLYREYTAHKPAMSMRRIEL